MIRHAVTLLMIALFAITTSAADNDTDSDTKTISKVLFIGDSMTGWMGERLNAYGKKNGFEVATIVWDGSTIAKWANTPRLNELIKSNAPDAIFISLGMNELLERNPQKRLSASIDKLKKSFGDVPVLWIGPPSWPGNPGGETLDNYLAAEMGHSHYYHSLSLDIPRQGVKNPHPSREGIIKWIDGIVEWIPDNTDLKFKSLDKPGRSEMSRGEVYIYKRINQQL